MSATADIASQRGLALGQDDLSPVEARRLIGADAMLGFDTASSGWRRRRCRWLSGDWPMFAQSKVNQTRGGSAW